MSKMSSTDETELLLQSIRDDCLGSYRSQPKRLTGDIGNESENQSNYHGRFIYELLQNADDVLDDREERVARFELHDDRLYMAHTGKPFTPEDVEALCILGVSSKRDEYATIGQKGRGFTSVLEITDSPAAYSTTYDFCFDRDRAYQEIQTELDLDRDIQPEGVPVLTLPFPPTSRPERVTDLLASGTPFTTVFEFELKEGLYDAIMQRLSDLDPETILFLRSLERFEIAIGDDEFAWELDRTEKNTESSIEITEVDLRCDGSEADWAPDATQHQYVKFRKTDIPVTHRGGLEGPNWEKVEYTEVGAAVRYDDRPDGTHLKPFEETPFVHLFLPTEEESPFPMLVNGAFNPDSSRTGIPITDEKEGYNAFLLREIADLIASDVLSYAADTATTVPEFLTCLHFKEEMLSAKVTSYLAEATASALDEASFLPGVGDDLSFTISDDRYALSDLLLPYSHPDSRWLGQRIAALYGTSSIPEHIDPQERNFPAVDLLDEIGLTTLASLGVNKLDPTEIPPLLADGPDATITLNSYTEVGSRRKVDPVLDVVIGIENVLSNDDLQQLFLKACNTEAIFPVNVHDDGTFERVSTENVNLLFPPEEFDLRLRLDGVQFLASKVYRPDGWEQPRGQHGDSDEFQSDLESIWDINTFEFQSFAQAVLLPRLPRSRGSHRDPADLESIDRLQVVKQLAVDSVKPSSPLPHEPRKVEDLYRLCMLPVPTKSQGWQPAHTVYFGPEWFDNTDPDWATPTSILANCENIDPPVLRAPDTFETAEAGSNYTPASDELDDEETLEAAWYEFFKWLGVAPHLRLTPLFNPASEREYAATADLGRPSDTHPTLGGLSQSDWERFRAHLENAVADSAASDRNNLSIYRANRLEYWPHIKRVSRDNTDIAVRLFCHLAYWWERRYTELTTVGVGGHSRSASGVASRSDGIPNSTEQYPLGYNLWLWELRNAPWCPSIHGQYEPTRVWKRSQSLIDQFTINNQGIVLLPLLHEQIETNLGSPPDALCRALDIRETIASGDFKPGDAKLVCRLLADWSDTAIDEEITDNLPTLRTAYRELASVMPPRRTEEPPEAWQHSQQELGSIPILCEVGTDTYEIRSARDAYFVTSQGERGQIPLEEPEVFVLQENDAGAFGAYFGMTSLIDAVEMEPQVTSKHHLHELTEDAVSFLREREDALRCVLARDRPARTREDAAALNRFIEELQLVSKLKVAYTLDSFQATTSQKWFIKTGDTTAQRRTPYVLDPSEGTVYEVVDTIAKTLCEFLDYQTIGDIVLILSTKSDAEREDKLALLDAPQEILSSTEANQDTTLAGLGTVGDRHPDQDDADQAPKEPDSQEVDAAQEEFEDEQVTRKTSSQDPTERIYSAENIGYLLEDGSEVKSLDTDFTKTGFGGKADSSNRKSDREYTTSPKLGGIREALNQEGRKMAYNYECTRLTEDYDVEDPEQYVFYIDDHSHIQRARKHPQAADILRWLTQEVGLDITFPGFDILTINPDTSAGEPTPDRLIEIKSQMEDDPVNVSLNEWYTANDDRVQDDYYLYIVANLGRDIGEAPFIRTVQNPGEFLRANPKQQTSISLEVDTRRFASGGTVREIPLRNIKD